VVDVAPTSGQGFNPRLTSAARRTLRCRDITACGDRFNPRLTSAARRTSSIHPSGIFLDICFNPRLTSAARRTAFELSRGLTDGSFNPRLTSAARRTRTSGFGFNVALFQSTPHFSSEANKAPRSQGQRPLMFQSTPHFSSEANSISAVVAVAPPAFQSTPHFSSEANTSEDRAGFTGDGFQSTPHFSSEANKVTSCHLPCSTCVSIHASLQQRGEPILDTCRNLNFKGFNPRLTSAARRTQRLGPSLA